MKAAQQQQQEARLRVRLVLLSLGLLRLLLMRPNLRPGSLPALPAMQEPQLLHDPIFEYSRTVLIDRDTRLIPPPEEDHASVPSGLPPITFH